MVLGDSGKLLQRTEAQAFAGSLKCRSMPMKWKMMWSNFFRPKCNIYFQFVTGTSSVPYDGFKALGGKRRFTVLQLGNPDQLPM